MTIEQLHVESRQSGRLLTSLRHFSRASMHLSSVGLGLLLITGGMWATPTLLRPQVAQAYKSRVDVRLARLRDETYASLIRRAEIVARAAAQRSFDRDILMSEVSVMVLGEHQGTEAPLLILEVSRQNWRNRPDTRRWAIYYRSAKRLLKLPSSPDPVIPNASRQPATPPLPSLQPTPSRIAPPRTAPRPTRSTPVPVPAPARPAPASITPASTTPATSSGSTATPTSSSQSQASENPKQDSKDSAANQSSSTEQAN